MQTSTMVKLATFAVTVYLWQMMLGTVGLALGLLILVFIHEMGHFLAARQIGLSVSLPVFTPIGALIAMRSQPANARDEAYVALAGPVVGTVGSITTLALGLTMGVPELMELAKLGFMLNLFNLVPLAPMDGGRISMTLSRHLWVLGVLLLVYIVFSSGFSMMTTAVAVIVVWQAMGDIANRRKMAVEQPQYFQVSAAVRSAFIAAYLGLAAFLAWSYFQPQGLISLMTRLGL